MIAEARDAICSMYQNGFVGNDEFKSQAFAFALLEWRNRALVVVTSTPHCDISGAYAKAALDWSPAIFGEMLHICNEWKLPTKMDRLHRVVSSVIGLGLLEPGNAL